MKVRLAKTVLLGVAALVLLGACSGSYTPEERSSRDQSRTDAQAIDLDTAVTDAVDRLGGDATDWKSFVVENPGPITVEIFWDSDSVEGEFGLYDQYGGELEVLQHRRGRQAESMQVRVGEAGIYYIRIYASALDSTYSVRVFEGTGHGTTTSQGDPRPEFDSPL